MKITLEMPLVSSCTVSTCAYNRAQSCRARAITIGDGRRPGCDTFFDNPVHTHAVKRLAGVGACKVADCKYNQDFECNATEIEVGLSGAGRDVLCMTFDQR